jgi:bifunctional DNase/RNase
MIEVEVAGIRLELPSNQPVLVLRDDEHMRQLQIIIGSAEATAIAFALEGVNPPRPLTHDLLADVIEHLGATLASICISELADGIFYAVLNFDNHEPISARPSDAVALAIRCGVPVLVNPEVIDVAGTDITDDDDVDADDELEKFREFLDNINPEDF